MTPRQLKYFVEIARSGSITTAAGVLHIAQPALSHHIAAMEEELGVPLLERHARGVKLTVQGQRLLDRATAILRQMDGLRDDVRDASTAARGTVRLCIVNSVAPLLAVPLFRLLEARTPEIRLELATGMSSEARALLEARRVDLALLPTGFELARLQAVPALEERFCLFGRPWLMPGDGDSIRFRDLRCLPLAAPDRAHDLRKLVEREALAQNCPLDVRYEINSAELLRLLVREGLALAVMPRNAFPPDEVQALAVREIVEPVMERTQSVAWVVDQALTPAGEAVRHLLLELIAGLIEDGTLIARRPA